MTAALDLLGGRASPIVVTAPLGPSRRRFANAVTIIASDEAPGMLLDRLKSIECDFGRRGAQRWSARVIDLDIILWSGGCWAGPKLIVPHASFRERAFALRPLAAVAPGWRDPVTGLTVRQLLARLTARRPIPRSRSDGWGP